ncbi:translocase [uncultured archaeon]|nr:translocase [uncultured archaeon]
MMFSIEEILIIAVVGLILFGGAKKIPDLARSMGRATGEFKRGQLELEKEIKNSMYATSSTAPKDGKVDFREVAKNMGIVTDNKDENQLKAEIAEKLKN